MRSGPTAAVAALALLLMAASVQAQETLEIMGHDDGGEFYFTVEGLDGRNPTIRLEAGSDVTVEFRNDGPTQLHNVHFGDPIDESTEVIEPGQTRTLEFTVPSDASGSGEYWCDPHRDLGMQGDVEFTQPDEGDGDGVGGGDGDGPGNGAPGPGLLVVLACLALAAARRR